MIEVRAGSNSQTQPNRKQKKELLQESVKMEEKYHNKSKKIGKRGYLSARARREKGGGSVLVVNEEWWVDWVE